jgi:hypothetical protein
MPSHHWGGNIEDVDLTPTQPLGFEVVQDNNDGQGDKVWIYVENEVTAAAAFAIGTVVGRLSGATTTQGILSAASVHPDGVIGVAQHVIASGSYGFILRKGQGLVLADTGGLTANLGIIPGNAVTGRADDAAAVTGAAFGFCIVAATATNTATCQIDCKG